MRELKFRAWDEDYGKYVYSPQDCDLDVFWERVLCGDIGYGGIEQYTGLKDADGKEIYEGDIITSPHIVKKGATVTWYDYGWSIGTCWPFSEYLSAYGCCDFLVVGNTRESQ